MKTYTYSYQNGLCRGREAGEVPGQLRRRPQTPPRPRKVSNKLFQGFRGLGKAQTSCFKVSDASGRLRTAPAGAGKPAGYPKGPECTYPCRGGRLRTPANLAGYPKGPECTYRCRGRRLRTPANLAGCPKGPECTYHGRGGRLRTPANLAGYPKRPECMYPCRGVSHTPTKRAPGPEWMNAGYDHPPRAGAPGRAYSIRPYTGTHLNT